MDPTADIEAPSIAPPKPPSGSEMSNAPVPRRVGDGKSSQAVIEILAQLDADRKAFATMQAKLAFRGFALHAQDDGSFLAVRWNCCKPLADLAEVHAFLHQVSGGSA